MTGAELDRSGPYETEREAREAARQAAGSDSPRVYVSSRANRAMLTGAVDSAGVQLGAWDKRIVDWLAGWEPETVAVVAGLITRAHEAGGQR